MSVSCDSLRSSRRNRQRAVFVFQRPRPRRSPFRHPLRQCGRVGLRRWLAPGTESRLTVLAVPACRGAAGVAATHAPIIAAPHLPCGAESGCLPIPRVRHVASPVRASSPAHCEQLGLFLWPTILAVQGVGSPQDRHASARRRVGNLILSHELIDNRQIIDNRRTPVGQISAVTS